MIEDSMQSTDGSIDENTTTDNNFTTTTATKNVTTTTATADKNVTTTTETSSRTTSSKINQSQNDIPTSSNCESTIQTTNEIGVMADPSTQGATPSTDTSVSADAVRATFAASSSTNGVTSSQSDAVNEPTDAAPSPDAIPSNGASPSTDGASPLTNGTFSPSDSPAFPTGVVFSTSPAVITRPSPTQLPFRQTPANIDAILRMTRESAPREYATADNNNRDGNYNRNDATSNCFKSSLSKGITGNWLLFFGLTTAIVGVLVLLLGFTLLSYSEVAFGFVLLMGACCMMVVGILRLNRESKEASRASGRTAAGMAVGRRGNQNGDERMAALGFWEGGASQPPSEFYHEDNHRAAPWAYTPRSRGVADRRMPPPGEAPPAYQQTVVPIQPPSYEEATAAAETNAAVKERVLTVVMERSGRNEQQQPPSQQQHEQQPPKPGESQREERRYAQEVISSDAICNENDATVAAGSSTNGDNIISDGLAIQNDAQFLHTE